MLGNDDGDGWSSFSRSSSDGGFDGGQGCSTMAMAMAMVGLLSLNQAQSGGFDGGLGCSAMAGLLSLDQAQSGGFNGGLGC